ncbi:Mechanosensitive channel MscK precursor [Pirellulimonas nuda]|uniref:Mechanosensitive channel MscK n=1 Tax=Pirellulimonas nuda TaxID=2528009 RepID=A0A518D8J7_9BACT|nr:mechanosensitive ion channel domain-containing protein [Pirellulimonas nuda]QDU87796.1 Mechanosensitive channel MscK precursor [Pirellulimonas nuda]
MIASPSVVTGCALRRPRVGWAHTPRLVLLAALLLPAGGLLAAEGAPEPPAVAAGGAATGLGADAIAQRRQEIASRLARLEEAIGELAKQSPPGRPSTELLTQRKFLEIIDSQLAQQQSVVARRDELAKQEAALRLQLDDHREFGHPARKPYSFLLLEDLLDQQATEQTRQESLRIELSAVRDLAVSLREAHDTAETHRRLAKEALEINDDPAATAELSKTLNDSQLASTASSDGLALRRGEAELCEAKLKLGELRLRLLEEQITAVRPDVAVTPQDQQRIAAELDAKEQRLRQKLDRLLPPTARADHETAEPADRVGEAAAEALVAHQLAQEAHQQRRALLQQSLGNCATERLLWERRFQALTGQVSEETLAAWREDLADFQSRCQQFRRMIEVRSEERRSELAGLEERVANSGPAAGGLGKQLAYQRAELRGLLDAYGESLTETSANQRLLDRMQSEIQGASSAASIGQWLRSGSASFRALWRYELAAVDDRPVTVGKVVSGLLLLLAGYAGSRWVSRQIGRRVLPRLGLGGGASKALESIAFYTLVVAVGLMSLEMVHVPLTVFTFFGGAAAIGLGFGSQTVLSNFISGLLLLVERPIRAGDLVEIDGLLGTVEDVGARATRIRTDSNLEILVPNSKFLEFAVTNWTLSDDLNRLQINVGVAYGSPTRETARLLKKSVGEDPHVLTHPAPVVVFRDFGDNALAFEIHFWVHMKTVMQGEEIKSDIRLAIDDTLRDAGISIAFPQRDVHLDTSRPLEICVRGAADEAAAGPWKSANKAA